MAEKELNDRCNLDDCSGYVCEFHSLRPETQEFIIALESEFEKLVRYVREYKKHKKGTNWYDVEKAYQALSDETRKAIEHDPQN